MGTYFSSSKDPEVLEKAQVVLKEFKQTLPRLLLHHVYCPPRPAIPRWVEVDYCKRGRHASFVSLGGSASTVVTITPSKKRRKRRKRPGFYREVPIQSWAADI